ncbi:MAG: precorrin-3B C(17)-methyltransferase [Parvularculales bacterium]
MSDKPPVIVVLNGVGAQCASKLRTAWTSVEVHGLRSRVHEADYLFDDVASHIRKLFIGGRPIIGLCATGILIRSLAGVLKNKHKEPPVLAIAEDGSAVVPLLGGHRGGNRLAVTASDCLGVAPTLTTAGDVRFGITFDAPPKGFVLAQPDKVTCFMADVLNGESIRVEGKAPWLDGASLPRHETARHVVRVTHEVEISTPNKLVYYEQCLALGVGCERGVTGADMIALAHETLAEHNLAPESVAVIASLEVKIDEAAVHETAAAFNVETRFFDSPTLEALTPQLLNPSQSVYDVVGCHGVSEAAALAAVGEGAVLVAPKNVKGQITCAVASGLYPLVGDYAAAPLAGRKRGVLSVVGLGPGALSWRTPEAQEVLQQAQDIVGYRKYIDMAGSFSESQNLHHYELGEEVARVRHALDLAASGRQVALVCSGDPGIYAMAALVFEELDRAEQTGTSSIWRQCAVHIMPGISAFQAAAARAGAPLGHDFVVISLSDLLTPWPVIERRLEAAASADFAVALYNPVSKTRLSPLENALDIFRKYRTPETPVVIGNNLGRTGEKYNVVRLDMLEASMLNMVSVALVGASQTRLVERRDSDKPWVYTPRGYHGAS